MKREKHDLPALSVSWQPHAGDRETRTGALAPKGKNGDDGRYGYGQKADA